MPDLIDRLNDWLMSRALTDADHEVTLAMLGNRLVAGGLPLRRIVVGRGLAHPVIGLASLVWDREGGRVVLDVTPPGELTLEQVRATAFGHLNLSGAKTMLADLRDPAQAERFELFRKLPALCA